MSEPKKSSSSSHRFPNIGHARNVLGEDVCNNILFVHAMLGCDITSRLFGGGKEISLHLVQESVSFRAQASIFQKQSATKDEIVAAGERAMILTYKGRKKDSLSDFRLKSYYAKITSYKVEIHPHKLQPTSPSAMFHSFRVYHQVQEWMGNSLPLEEWGWRIQDSCLIPIHSDQNPAPQSLLELVHCSRKSGCSTMRCKCRRQRLDCSLACSERRGVCGNMMAQNLDEDVE